MSDRKEYLKKWREENKEHIKQYKKEYAKNHDSSFKKLQKENAELKSQIEHYRKTNEHLLDKNNILLRNAEHNDKVLDKVNWENQLLKQRIDKAIEYATDEMRIVNDNEYHRLLEILKGDSNE